MVIICDLEFFPDKPHLNNNCWFWSEVFWISWLTTKNSKNLLNKSRHSIVYQISFPYRKIWIFKKITLHQSWSNVQKRSIDCNFFLPRFSTSNWDRNFFLSYFVINVCLKFNSLCANRFIRGLEIYLEGDYTGVQDFNILVVRNLLRFLMFRFFEILRLSRF